jgi:GNAT superfamily N-acetyltransferase
VLYVPPVRTRDLPATRTGARALPLTSTVVEGEGHRVITTAERPDFRFGNYLELDLPPHPAEVPAWLERCGAEIAVLVERHLVWETELSSAPVEVPGLLHERNVVLRAHTLEGGAMPEGITIRPLLGGADFAALVEVTISEDTGEFEGFADWARWRSGAFQETFADGRGRFWGAFDGETLAGSLGLLAAPDALRFQEVMTHPAYRRRGICAALVHAALADARIRFPDPPVYIVADPAGDAARLYTRLGFRPVGWACALREPATVSDR